MIIIIENFFESKKKKKKNCCPKFFEIAKLWTKVILNYLKRIFLNANFCLAITTSSGDGIEKSNAFIGLTPAVEVFSCFFIFFMVFAILASKLPSPPSTLFSSFSFSSSFQSSWPSYFSGFFFFTAAYQLTFEAWSLLSSVRASNRCAFLPYCSFFLFHRFFCRRWEV